jgi:hypothetical protein
VTLLLQSSSQLLRHIDRSRHGWTRQLSPLGLKCAREHFKCIILVNHRCMSDHFWMPEVVLVSDDTMKQL